MYPEEANGERVQADQGGLPRAAMLGLNPAGSEEVTGWRGLESKGIGLQRAQAGLAPVMAAGEPLPLPSLSLGIGHRLLPPPQPASQPCLLHLRNTVALLRSSAARTAARLISSSRCDCLIS